MKYISRFIIVCIFFFLKLSFSDYNIAPYSDIKSIPYGGFSLTRLVDGIVIESEKSPWYAIKPEFCTRTGQTDMRFGAEVTFSFPEEKDVKKIRIFSSSKEIEYKIFINGIEKGKTEKGKEGWKEIAYPYSIKTKEIKVKASGGNKPVYFDAEEIEIIVKGNPPEKKEVKETIKLAKQEVLKNVKLEKDNLKRVLYVLGPFIYENPEWWAKKITNLGVNTIVLYAHYYGNIKAFEEGKYTIPSDPEVRWYLKRGIKFLKEKGKNRLVIASWPSKVVPGTKTNYLKRVCEVMHKNNIKVIVSVGFFIPFDTVKQYLHGGQSDWHLLPPCPCLINDDFPVKLGEKLYSEIIKNGADGIILGGDEFGAEGHRFTTISPYDPCIKKFLRKYGYKELPIDAEDTLKYRRWEIFEYEGVANLFKKWTTSIKKVKSDVIATSLLISWPICFSDRMWSGLAYDIIGFKSGMDYITLDYYRPLTTIKRLIGANPERKGGYLWRIGFFRPGYLPFEREIDIYGPLLAVLGQSGEELASIELYEHRHIITPKKDEERERGYKIVKNTFNLIKYLQKEGIDEAKTPEKIAILYSRAGEDWWQLKNGYIQSVSPTIMKNTYGTDWMKIFTEKIAEERTFENLEQMKGYIWHQAIMDLLTSYGYPYDLYYLDQVKSLKNLERYDVLIIPFCYSISQKSVRLIKNAIKKGTKLILINYKGETDQWGEKYRKPLFEDLKENEGKFIKVNINNISEKQLAKKILPLIDSYIEGPFYKFQILNNKNLHGKVFCFFLEKENKYFITLLNFGKEKAYVKISLPSKIKNLKGATICELKNYQIEKTNTFLKEILPFSGEVLIAN